MVGNLSSIQKIIKTGIGNIDIVTAKSKFNSSGYLDTRGLKVVNSRQTSEHRKSSQGTGRSNNRPCGHISLEKRTIFTQFDTEWFVLPVLSRWLSSSTMVCQISFVYRRHITTFIGIGTEHSLFPAHLHTILCYANVDNWKILHTFKFDLTPIRISQSLNSLGLPKCLFCFVVARFFC